MASNAVNASLSDKMAKMQQKVKLIQGELRANEDSAQSTITQNREAIAELRQKNKELRRALVRFHATHHRIVSGNMAVLMLKEESMSKMKQLNAMVHATQVSRQRLEDLKLQYLTLKPGRSKAEEHGRKTQEANRKRRGLDNSLAKAQLKFRDAERISEGYFKIKQELKLEGFSFQNQLDCLDASILENREELFNLRVANNAARLSTEAAEAELRQLEERLSREHEERERVLELYRTQVQECKAQAEHAVQTAVRSHCKFQIRGAFRHLKAVTRLPNAQETVERFVTQGEITVRLERTKAEKEETVQALFNKTGPLELALSDLKYCMAEKRSREERILATPQNKLRDAGSKQVKDKCDLDNLVGTLGNVGPIVERIADKLLHIRLDTEEDKDEDEDDDDDDDDDDDYEKEEAAKAEEEEEHEVTEPQPETPPAEEDEQAPPAVGNYWTDLQSTFQTMVQLLAQCASKLLRLQDENLAAEEERRRASRKAKLKRQRAPQWNAPKRQNSATKGHIRRLKELEKSKRRGER